jgi:hypothetical protein
MFQGFVNKMTVIMKFSAVGPIDIPPWCNVYVLGMYRCGDGALPYASWARGMFPLQAFSWELGRPAQPVGC